MTNGKIFIKKKKVSISTHPVYNYHKWTHSSSAQQNGKLQQTPKKHWINPNLALTGRCWWGNWRFCVGLCFLIFCCHGEEMSIYWGRSWHRAETDIETRTKLFMTTDEEHCIKGCIQSEDLKRRRNMQGFNVKQHSSVRFERSVVHHDDTCSTVTEQHLVIH